MLRRLKGQLKGQRRWGEVSERCVKRFFVQIFSSVGRTRKNHATGPKMAAGWLLVEVTVNLFTKHQTREIYSTIGSSFGKRTEAKTHVLAPKTRWGGEYERGRGRSNTHCSASLLYTSIRVRVPALKLDLFLRRHHRCIIQLSALSILDVCP